MIFRLNAIQIKISVAFFTEIEQISKFIWNHKRPPKNLKGNNLIKKNKIWGIILVNLSPHYKAMVIIKTFTSQWTRIENEAMKSHMYNPFLMEIMIYSEKRIATSINGNSKSTCLHASPTLPNIRFSPIPHIAITENEPSTYT